MIKIKNYPGGTLYNRSTFTYLNTGMKEERSERVFEQLLKSPTLCNNENKMYNSIGSNGFRRVAEDS